MPEHKLPAKFIKKIQGKDFVLFEGLLEMAHAAGLKRVETQLLQAPSKDNGMLAIVRAVIETEKGVFSALGDASLESAERPLQPHLVRLADTRAIARAMRLAVNVGMTALEEINTGDQVAGADRGKSAGDTHEDKEAESVWLENPAEVVLTFGKHADKTLGDLLIEDPTYVEWLAREAYDFVLRAAARKLLDANAPGLAEYESTGTSDIVFD